MTNPTELHQGVLKVWNAGPYTADVQLTGLLQLWLKGVPVARDIAGVEMVVGRRVAGGPPAPGHAVEPALEVAERLDLTAERLEIICEQTVLEMGKLSDMLA